LTFNVSSTFLIYSVGSKGLLKASNGSVLISYYDILLMVGLLFKFKFGNKLYLLKYKNNNLNNK